MDLHQQKPTDHPTHFDRDFTFPVKPQNRWSLACNSIYFIVSLSKIVLKNTQPIKSIVAPSLSYIAVDIDDDPDSSIHDDVQKTSSFPFCISRNTLTSTLRNENLAFLSELGREHLAFTPGTIKSHGVSNNTKDLLLRKTKPVKSFLSFVIGGLRGITIIQVLFGVFSIGLGVKVHGLKQGWYDGSSIFLSVFLTLLISSIINFKHSEVLKEISNKISDIQVVRALRDGCSHQISVFEVVKGDIIFLKVGDKIPADGKFLDGCSLTVAQPNTDGEVVINAENPSLFLGTKVVDGYGRMLVDDSVGKKTIWEEVNNPIHGDFDDPRKPLQEQLKTLTSYIIMVGLLVALLVFLVLSIRYFTGNTKDDLGNREFSGRKNKSNNVMDSVSKIISAVLTVIVIAIPEGLQLAVTLTVSHLMKMMLNQGIIIRRLSIWKNMGSVTTICTDKTGFLTLSQMDVTEFWVGKDKVENPSLDVEFGVVKLLQEAVGLNTSGDVSQATPQSTSEIHGSPMEKAILKWGVSQLEVMMDKLNRSFEVLKFEAFKSKEMQSWVMAKQKMDNSIQLHFKGAAEAILARCSNYYDRKGVLITMADNDKEDFRNITEMMGRNSLTCIAFARKQVEAGDEYVMQLHESGLTLLGVVGLTSPFQPSVEEALKSCRDAGVGVKFITEENVFTARAIGVQCGILSSIGKSDEEIVIEGIEFRNYSDEERLEKIDNIRVMASASPEDKLFVVQCLKQKGHVMAVIGDGTHDSSALNEADISLSMGTEGAQVEKESSDIIVLDGKFSSIVTILKWGRCGYNNIQKVIQVQLTIIAVGYIVSFIVAISSGKVPLLWVNLTLDTLVALALTTEQPIKGDGLMKKPPIRTNKGIIVSKVIWRNIIGQTLYQVAILLTLQFKGKSMFGVDDGVRNTLIFNSFVLCQVFNVFNARNLEKKNVFDAILENRSFWLILGITVVIQISMVELLSKFANTERLSGGQWAACISAAALCIPIGWLLKYIHMPDSSL